MTGPMLLPDEVLPEILPEHHAAILQSWTEGTRFLGRFPWPLGANADMDLFGKRAPKGHTRVDVIIGGCLYSLWRPEPQVKHLANGGISCESVVEGNYRGTT